MRLKERQNLGGKARLVYDNMMSIVNVCFPGPIFPGLMHDSYK